MEKKMEAVTVYVSDNNEVCIKSEDYGDGEHIIFLNPHQIDTVIQWLEEAKSEALQNKQPSTAE